MTTDSIISGGYQTGVANTANATTYNRLGGFPNSTSTESNESTTFRSAGTLKNLYVRLTANTCSGNTTYTARKNGTTNGTNTVTFATTVTGALEDTTPHSDTVTAGDTWNVQILPAASTTGTNTASNIRCLFTATTNTVTRFATSSDTSFTAASTTYYAAINGVVTTSSTIEAVAQCLQRKAGTFTNMAVHVSANSRTTTTTVQGRLDTGSGAANGALVVSVTTLTTGTIEDTTHTDTVAVGNKYNMSMAFGSDTSKTLTLRSLQLDFTSTAGFMQCCCADSSGSAATSTAQKYNPVSGRIIATGSNETQAKMLASQALQFSNLSINISTNSSAGAGTVVFRKNGANANQSASVTASTSGFYSDSTNVDYVVSTDDINYGYAAGAASGTTIGNISSWAIKGYPVPLSDSASISDTTPQRLVGRRAQTIFAHTTN